MPGELWLYQKCVAAKAVRCNQKELSTCVGNSFFTPSLILFNFNALQNCTNGFVYRHQIIKCC